MKLNRLSIAILTLTLLLAGLGFIFIYSASSYSAELRGGDALHYVNKQLIGFLIGLVCMLGCVFIKTDRIYKFRYYILGISFLLLALVFIPGLGIESYGARRWLNLGIITLQPSEISKFGLVVFIAGYMSKHKIGSLVSILPVLAVGGAMCVLIMLEPNMSITICTGAVMFLMLAVGGSNTRNFVILAIPVIALFTYLMISEPYRLDRLSAFIDPWSSPKDEGYQLIQSYYALGSGGLFGTGLFNSRQKFLFLPFAESDFIFAIIGEETGLFGCVIVIAIFIALIYCGFIAAARARNPFESYLAGGISIVIAVQTLLNIAVVSGCIPPTGLPLPFISAGGSSLMVFMAASGLLINIANKKRQ